MDLSKLEDFLRSNGTDTKILFARKISVGNALIRQANLRDQTGSFNTLVYTPVKLAREILEAANSGDLKFLESDCCTDLMLNVLRGAALVPKSAVTLSTARDVLGRINELRDNKTKPEYADDVRKVAKIKELDAVLHAYEKTLEDLDVYDDTRTLTAATKYCKDDPEKLSKLLPFIKGAVFADLETNRLSVREREFMNAVADAAGRTITTLPYLGGNPNGNMSFFAARGIANEVRAVANKIEELSSDQGLGTVAVYYTSPEYRNFIKAVFDSHRIRYACTDKIPSQELYLTQMIISLLDCAAEDMSYKLLEKVVRNRVITFDNVLKNAGMNAPAATEEDFAEEDIAEEELSEKAEEEIDDKAAPEAGRKDSVKVNPIRGYRETLAAGIGWGRQRYIEYYDRIKDDPKTEEGTRIFAKFLFDLANVFDERYSIGEIYAKLWDFVQLYTYRINKEKTALSSALKDKESELMLIDSSSYTLAEKISFIRDLIVNMGVDDTTETENAVLVSPIRDYSIMERPHNFIMGLSATSFLADDKQSPILLDEEKLRYIEGAGDERSPVELASDKNERLAATLKDTLGTRDESSDVTISYSYYDTIALRQGSPSILFLELSEGKEVDIAPGYKDAPYSVNNDISIATEDISDSVKERAEKIRAEREAKRKDKQKEETKDAAGSEEKKALSMSATGIQTLLACPLKYYYAYTRYLMIDEHMTPKGHEWLDFRNKGNLCHYFMEKYMQSADPLKGIDRGLFDKCYDETIKEMEEQQPWYSEHVRDREIGFYKDKIKGYLEYMTGRWKEDAAAGKKWRVIGCELAFGKLDETGTIQPKFTGDGYSIKLNGSIDRVDGYTDADGKLKIRIIDYKTGKKENKEKEIKLNVQIQHFLYAMAMEEYLKSEAGKKRLGELFGIGGEADYEFEWIGYTFPYEDEAENRELDTTADVTDNIEDKKVSFPKEITSRIDNIIGNTVKENEDVIAGLMEDAIECKRADIAKYKVDKGEQNVPEQVTMEDFCKENHCVYKDICRKWVAAPEDDTLQEDEE